MKQTLVLAVVVWKWGATGTVLRVLAVEPGYLTVALDSNPCFSSGFLTLGFSVFICIMESSTMQISPH